MSLNDSFAAICEHFDAQFAAICEQLGAVRDELYRLDREERETRRAWALQGILAPECDARDRAFRAVILESAMVRGNYKLQD